MRTFFPARSGISDYTLDVARLLADAHHIDLFHDGAVCEVGDLPASCATYPATEFLARQASEPYDLAIYQMGNGPAHDFLYPLLARVPVHIIVEPVALLGAALHGLDLIVSAGRVSV